MRSRLKLIALCMAHAASALAAINNGVAVTTLPTPDGDGAYVFGNASYTTGAFFCDNGTSCFAGGLAYPVWDYIGVPSGSTVKFVGGVALSSLPAGCSFDFSGCTHLFVTDESVFGFGFSGMYIYCLRNSMLIEPEKKSVYTSLFNTLYSIAALRQQNAHRVGRNVLHGSFFRSILLI